MAATRTGSKRLLRDLNQSIVLNLIVEQGSISRTDLARRSGLPAATITRIAHEFLSAGLICEVTSEASSGGRRPVLLSINPHAAYVIGVKLREDGLLVALCDLNCSVITTHEEPLCEALTPAEITDTLARTVTRCIEQAAISIERVLGVGVGLSGIIDSTRGLCRYSSLLGWREYALASILELKLGLPVRIDNDVNTLAILERYFGAGRDSDNFLLVTVGRGIGLGIVIRSEIYRGSRGGAGEFGHTCVDTSANALLCNCGKYGCLETLASDMGIVRAAGLTVSGPSLDSLLNTVLVQAHLGEAAVLNAFKQAGTVLGIAIANLANIFDPSLILIAGEGLRAGDFLLQPLRAALPAHIFGPGSSVNLVTLTTSEVNWARGAASLILREVFQPPIYGDQETAVIDNLFSQTARFSYQRR